MLNKKQDHFNSRKVRKQRIKQKRKHVEPVIIINEDAQTYMFGYTDEKYPTEFGRIEYDPVTEKPKFIPVMTYLPQEVTANG